MQKTENIIISRLPKVRGKIRLNADMAKVNWFQVGGLAEILFKPEDVQDLSNFIAAKPADIPVMVLGVGSNLLIRDGGIDGVVIRLGRGFSECCVEGDRIIAGSSCLNSNIAVIAKENGIGGLEYLSGIPGSIGGALAMNAGAYGVETKDVLVEAELVDSQGNINIMTPKDMNYSYRNCGLSQGSIFTRATLQGRMEAPDVIAIRMNEISQKRNATQPVRSRTGGSTFKNPDGFKAWKLIEDAGCRGLSEGGAQISEMHCNFMINTGNATADDLERLGENVRRRVFENSGIMLEWEIKIIGKIMISVKEEGFAAA